MSPRDVFRQAGPVFIAVGESNRQQIILLLCEYESMGVNELTTHLSISRPAVSHHLKVLQSAGLIKVVRLGTQRLYSLDIGEGINLLKDFVSAIEQSQKFKEGRL